MRSFQIPMESLTSSPLFFFGIQVIKLTAISFTSLMTEKIQFTLTDSDVGNFVWASVAFVDDRGNNEISLAYPAHEFVVTADTNAYAPFSEEINVGVWNWRKIKSTRTFDGKRTLQLIQIG